MQHSISRTVCCDKALASVLLLYSFPKMQKTVHFNQIKSAEKKKKFELKMPQLEDSIQLTWHFLYTAAKIQFNL